MKKNNKKLLNFWNKVKRPLMILSVVGNVLFLLFIIIGCLGIKKTKSSIRVNADDIAQVDNLRGTRWYMHNYVDTPKGNWSDLESGTSLEYEFFFVFGENGYDDEQPFNHQYRYLRFYRASSVTSSSVSFYRPQNYPTQIDAYQNQSSWAYDDYRYISISRGGNETDLTNRELIAWFYRNADLLFSPSRDSNFEFVKDFNYNAPYSASLSSPFCNTVTEVLTKTYDLPFFYTNGQLFNQIKLWYLNGLAMSYLASSGEVLVNNLTGTCYYSEMEYINTFTGESVPVNYRNFEVQGGKTYLINGSRWTNDAYRFLEFYEQLTPQDRDNIAQFNTSLINSNGFYETGSNIGLGSVFSLMSQAFMSFKGIFAIEILPNITIGLFFFLPLVVGIILTIIWLVKR